MTAYLSETNHPASVTLISAVSSVKELLLWVGLGYGAEVHVSGVRHISDCMEDVQHAARIVGGPLLEEEAPEVAMCLRHGKGTRAWLRDKETKSR